MGGWRRILLYSLFLSPSRRSLLLQFAFCSRRITLPRTLLCCLLGGCLPFSHLCFFLTLSVVFLLSLVRKRREPRRRRKRTTREKQKEPCQPDDESSDDKTCLVQPSLSMFVCVFVCVCMCMRAVFLSVCMCVCVGRDGGGETAKATNQVTTMRGQRLGNQQYDICHFSNSITKKETR